MLSESIKQVVVFKLGREEFGFDISVVRGINSVQDITKVHRSAPHIQGVMNLRGKLLTVVNLRTRLGMEPLREDDGDAKIIVIDCPNPPVGFMVDEVSEVVSIAPESIEKAPTSVTSGMDVQYVLGIAKLDGRLVTLIDPLRILELDSAEHGGADND